MLLLLLACLARAGEDEEAAEDADSARLSRRLRAIDEDVQREANRPDAVGEDADPGDEATVTAPRADTDSDTDTLPPSEADAGGEDEIGSETVAPAPAPPAVAKPARTAKTDDAKASGTPARSRPDSPPASPSQAAPPSQTTGGPLERPTP